MRENERKQERQCDSNKEFRRVGDSFSSRSELWHKYSAANKYQWSATELLRLTSNWESAPSSFSDTNLSKLPEAGRSEWVMRRGTLVKLQGPSPLPAPPLHSLMSTWRMTPCPLLCQRGEWLRVHSYVNVENDSVSTLLCQRGEWLRVHSQFGLKPKLHWRLVTLKNPVKLGKTTSFPDKTITAYMQCGEKEKKRKKRKKKKKGGKKKKRKKEEK